MKTLTVSRFNGKTDNRPKAEQLSWQTLKHLLTVFDVRSDKDGPLWSPTVFQAGERRRNETALEVSCLALDFDGGHDPSDLTELWRGLGLAFVAHSTWRHTDDAPRWRAVFPLSQPCPAADWSDLCRSATLYLGHGLAEEHADLARMFYTPSRRDGAPYWSDSADGKALDLRKVPRLSLDQDEPAAGTGDRPGDVFDQKATWEEILAPHGWRVEKRLRGGTVRWTRPGKDASEGCSARTGPGTLGDRFYCWSTSVSGIPANKPLKKFNLYAWLNHGGDFRAAAKELASRGYGSPSAVAAAKNCKPPTELPTIYTTDRQLRDLTSDAFAAIVLANDPPTVFGRSGELCRVEVDERGLARISGLSVATAKSRLARVADWRKETKGGPVNVSPPDEVVQDLLALGGWPGIPSLTVVSRCPLLGQDGRLRTHPGYDPASKSYITDGPFPEWDGDAGSAVRFLAEELLGDFPFVGEADLAGALALTVLPFVRPAIDGPTPLHLVDAPVQGSGKSLLVRACLWPALGSTAAATTATRDEEEWRKKITTALLEGRPAVFLDNLSKKLDSDSLAAVITSTEWSDRALGQMKAVNVPVRCVWAATANNAELSRDLARRTAYVRLDAQVERPEDRTGFRHPDIEAWCRNERPRLVSAVCKIVGDWAAAGRPLWTGAKIGSFEAWCAVVGGILTNAGVDGFLGNLSAMRTAVSDGEEQAWGALYADWYATWGSEPVAAAALHEKALEIEGLLSILGDAGPQSQKIRLGKALRHRVGVVVRGLKPVTAGSHQNAQRYSLVPVTNTEKHSPHSPLNLTLIDTSLSIGECQGAHSPNPNLGSVEPGQHGVDKQNPNGTLTEPASGSVSQVDSECSECSHARTRARDGHGSAVSHSEQNGARPSPTSPGMGAVEPETGSVRIEGTTSPTSQVQTEEEVW